MKNRWLFLFLASVLGSSSVFAQPQFVFSTNGNTLKIVGFYGSAPDLAIPGETNGYVVTDTANNVFQNHGEVTNVTIPNTLTNFGSGAFDGCTGILEFKVEPGSSAFSSLDGVLFNADQTTLEAFPIGRGGSYTLPSTVTNINDFVFDFGLNLTNVFFDDALARIGKGAFDYCQNLNGITLPAGLKSIDDDAFGYCYGIHNLVIPGGVTNIGDGAFGVCAFLTNVTIPPSVITIGFGAFSHTALENVTVPGSVTEISAFTGCTNLTNIVIGTGVKSIGAYAFQGCSSLRAITIPDGIGNIGEEAFSGTKLSRLVIPNSTTNIGGWAFQNIPSLTNAIIGSGVASIGESAFRTYPGSTNVTSFFFVGNAPSPGVGDSIFGGYTKATVYFLPGAIGWGTSFGGLPALLWNPQIKTTDGHFGIKTNQFEFNITGTTNIPIVVEAAPNLSGGSWTQLLSCNLTNGSVYFGDAQWTNFSRRFYRIRSP